MKKSHRLKALLLIAAVLMGMPGCARGDTSSGDSSVTSNITSDITSSTASSPPSASIEESTTQAPATTDTTSTTKASATATESKINVILPPDVTLEPKGVRLNVSNKANTSKLDGFGAEWDPHFWQAYNLRNGLTADDWYLVTNRVKELGIDRVRVMWRPEWHEPRNDNNNPFLLDKSKFALDDKNLAILSARRQLDFLQENGIKVTLTMWGAANDSWLSSGGTASYWNKPNDIDEYIENIIVILKFLVIESGYSCIDRFTAFNEPDLGYYGGDNKIDFNHYADMNKRLHNRMQQEGLGKVRLTVSDDSDTADWFTSSVSQLKSASSFFSTHSYIFSLQNKNSEIYAYFKGYYDLVESKAPSSHLVLDEFATNKHAGAYDATDTKTFERALFLPKITINFLNAGGSGASYWCMFDQYYYQGSASEAKMKQGLWGYKDENWSVRPTYHSWGLLTRYTSAGSEIYPITSPDEEICAVALKDTKGKVTYLIVNESKKSKDFTIDSSLIARAYFNAYVFNRASNTTSDKLAKPSAKLANSKNRLVGTIGSESFLVLYQE